MNFDQIREICISQGTVVTFFKCDEQIQSHLNGTLFQNFVFGNHSNWSIFDCFIPKNETLDVFIGIQCRPTCICAGMDS